MRGWWVTSLKRSPGEPMCYQYGSFLVTVPVVQLFSEKHGMVNTFRRCIFSLPSSAVWCHSKFKWSSCMKCCLQLEPPEQLHLTLSWHTAETLYIIIFKSMLKWIIYMRQRALVKKEKEKMCPKITVVPMGKFWQVSESKGAWQRWTDDIMGIIKLFSVFIVGEERKKICFCLNLKTWCKTRALFWWWQLSFPQ